MAIGRHNRRRSGCLRFSIRKSLAQFHLFGRLKAGITLLVLGTAAAIGAHPSASGEESPASSVSLSHRATLDTYCVVCHNEQLKTADLELDKANIANPSADAKTWEKVIRKLRIRAMPPQGMPRPGDEVYESLVHYLERTIDRDAAENLNPGRPAVHRLNRAEYTNAIRDLLKVDTDAVDVVSQLPVDDSGYGFDNIGDVLTVSPVILESYLSVARKVSRSAIGDPSASPDIKTYEIPRYLVQRDRMSEAMPLGSRGGLIVRHQFPLDAEYVLKIRLQRNNRTYVLGTGNARNLDVRLDGKQIKQFTMGGTFNEATRSEQSNAYDQGSFERYLMTADDHLEVRFPAKAGAHEIQVTFENVNSEPEGFYQPPITDYAYAWDYGHPDTEPAVTSVTIGGPYNATGISETASRKQIFVCYPATVEDEQPCAKNILSAVARRAFRRPVKDADVEELLQFFRKGREGGRFDDGIELALQRILVDPEFLFRIEKDPPQVAPGTAHRLSDIELASRLSFFIWSSIPDDQLLEVAERGELSKPAVLESQVRRMLRDARAAALVDNFFGQWLYLRNVQLVWPNPDVYPEFDANLRNAFERESRLFFESLLKEDKSILNLLNADFTFVNERLARHYQIPNVYGSRFRRVALQDENRKGILGQGSILTVTSYATRTAPTIRGKWLLENILGTPPPPPPPNVPSLDEAKGEDGRPLTVRQQMEMHRTNPVCASCHKVMDPLGFALENFDATGKWRTTDGGHPIDASGATPDGFALNGPADLRKYLLAQPDQFVHTVTEKLLTYALGRGAEYYDAPAIRQIMRQTADKDYRWSSLIVAIAKSTPFQMRRSKES